MPLPLTTATGTLRAAPARAIPTITPFSTYRAADGFFVIAAGNDDMFARVCAALGPCRWRAIRALPPMPRAVTTRRC